MVLTLRYDFRLRDVRHQRKTFVQIIISLGQYLFQHWTTAQLRPRMSAHVAFVEFAVTMVDLLHHVSAGRIVSYFTKRTKPVLVQTTVVAQIDKDLNTCVATRCH